MIDVEIKEIDSEMEKSIWYTAEEMLQLLNLNKSALQQAISKLTNIYAIDIRALRRGQARATRYSELALDAIELHKKGRFAELRKLLDRVPSAAPEVTSRAIVFLDRHAEIATTAATAADTNLAQISNLKSNLLNSYRQLGRVLGQQAAAEVQLGFTEELKSGIKKLQES